MDKGGVANAILGGWQLSTIFRYSSGIPFFFRSSFCNVPGQFRAACIPSIETGQRLRPGQGQLRPGARARSSTRTPSSPPDAFNFYYGNGPRVSELPQASATATRTCRSSRTRGSAGRMNLQLRIEAFNVWNWHNFGAPGRHQRRRRPPFNTDIASPDFGEVERERDRPAGHPARGAHRVLTTPSRGSGQAGRATWSRAGLARLLGRGLRLRS